ncbi:MAG: hypothetical protein A2162_03455 [Deltaproteobacteria bacterium RBG_13_52_11b]|nr:MAG: hypothetical protein A2162_03455 [Deltaproteobacteria bacterium RBG_13_52_11b]
MPGKPRPMAGELQIRCYIIVSNGFFSLTFLEIVLPSDWFHPPMQETTALAVEGCVNTDGYFPVYPYLTLLRRISLPGG